MEIKAKNLSLIMEVLEEMNLSPDYVKPTNQIRTAIGTFDLDTGKADVSAYNADMVNKFRVEYSKKALMVAAKKNKWVVKKRTGKNQFVAKKW
jgi:hypothetical protein